MGCTNIVIINISSLRVRLLHRPRLLGGQFGLLLLLQSIGGLCLETRLLQTYVLLCRQLGLGLGI